MVECHIRNGGHTSTVLGEAEEVGASALGAAAALLSIQLSKIPSKIAKFHLQIVENRLQFRSKISYRVRALSLPLCRAFSSSICQLILG